VRAMVMDRVAGPLEVRAVPDPVPPAGGVVVGVKATGLCRSDWHAWAGHEDVVLPHVPGHELAGLVSAGNPRLPMARVIAWELDLLGSHGMAAADYPAMLALIQRGELRPQQLIERVISLEEAARLLPAFDRARPAGMTMIDPQRL
jgi:D-arabinose 1-dehydrogenase-like Zn-dependent alcohol dehydrogenase